MAKMKTATNKSYIALSPKPLYVKLSLAFSIQQMISLQLILHERSPLCNGQHKTTEKCYVRKVFFETNLHKPTTPLEFTVAIVSEVSVIGRFCANFEKGNSIENL